MISLSECSAQLNQLHHTFQSLSDYGAIISEDGTLLVDI